MYDCTYVGSTCRSVLHTDIHSMVPLQRGRSEFQNSLCRVQKARSSNRNSSSPMDCSSPSTDQRKATNCSAVLTSRNDWSRFKRHQLSLTRVLCLINYVLL